MTRRKRRPVRQQWRGKRARVPVRRERPGPLAVLVYVLFFIRLVQRWILVKQKPNGVRSPCPPPR